MLFFFGMFMAYIVSQARNGDNPIADEGEYNLMPKLKSSLYIGAGVLGLFVGGKWVVDGAVMIANSFGLSESFVGLTIVAVGTSLPELVTSVVAASKKKIDIAVGNVVGSNIFNILWVLGLSAVIKPLQFSSVENTDILMMILGSTLLILSMAIGRRNTIDRWNGIIFILIYLGYLGYLVHRG